MYPRRDSNYPPIPLRWSSATNMISRAMPGVHRYTAAQFGLDERGFRGALRALEGAWG